jgi:polyketide biosynthesis acyl carrier protein
MEENMTSEQVFEVLKKYILDQLEDEVEEKDVTIEKSMFDLGANSLDVVEIVTNTMRELKVKVPRDQLSQVDSMQGLVNLLTEHANAEA